jgi:hypothetical protein
LPGTLVATKNIHHGLLSAGGSFPRIFCPTYKVILVDMQGLFGALSTKCHDAIFWISFSLLQYYSMMMIVLE